MEQINKEQNNVIIQIDDILNKMSNQVKFLIRNNKLMNQLDVDLLMENTRKMYDVLCSVRCAEEGVEEFSSSVVQEIESFEGEEEFRSSGVQEIEEFEEEDEIEEDDENENFESSKVSEFESSIQEEYEEFERDFEDDIEEDLDEEEEEEEEFEEDEEDEEDEEIEEFEEFEEDEEDEEIEEDEEEEIEEDEEEEEEEENENFESSKVLEFESSPQEEHDSGIRAYKRVYTVESKTLGDKLESVEDRSLAARLQRKPVTDLMNAIGINDKFLLLNELFAGSMEKYNKSIRALNSFSTLLGAKTYMSELQIEFQWDCESDAYKKLDSLVERRFM